MVVTAHDVIVLGVALPTVTAAVTLIRLFSRFQRRRFGCDDAFAAFSLSTLVIFMVTLFFILDDSDHMSQKKGVVMYYVMAQSFYATIWSARLSILFTIIRITPPGSLTRKVLYWIAGSFGVLWLFLFSQLLWDCERKPPWKILPSRLCHLTSDIAIAQLISDIYADAMIIIAPLKILWNLNLAWTERVRLLLVFSASIITTTTSLIHAYDILRVSGIDHIFVAILEVSSAVLVCNLAVIVSLTIHLIDACKSRFSRTTTTTATPPESIECFRMDLNNLNNHTMTTTTTMLINGGDGRYGRCGGQRRCGAKDSTGTAGLMVRVNLETVVSGSRGPKVDDGSVDGGSVDGGGGSAGGIERYELGKRELDSVA